MATISIRPYHPTDRSACLEIFSSNIPTFFTQEEEPYFIEWLDGLELSAHGKSADGVAYYFVAEVDGKVLGCGGWGIREGADHATLIWGAVHQDHHRVGIGDALTKYRIEDFRRCYATFPMTIDTSHRTAAFYERFGFTTERFTEDGYAPGLHRHDMRLRH